MRRFITIDECWTRFNEIRDTIHKARRIVYGVPPDHWEIIEQCAIQQLVLEETGKVADKAIEIIETLKKEIKLLNEEIENYKNAL